MDKSKLPGKKIALREKLEEIIRVDHAGEYGATRIYQGQIDKLQGRSDEQTMKTLYHMLDQEREHLSRFDEKLSQYKVNKTILSPLWHVAGYAMGYISASLGQSGAMACTVAVEETIDQHYKEQEDYLKSNMDEINGGKELYDLVHKCRMEELEHRDIGLENNAEKAPFYGLLYGAVKWSSKLAIALSKKI